MASFSLFLPQPHSVANRTAAVHRSTSVIMNTGPTLVAVDQDKHGQFIVKWALDHLSTSSSFTLVHVLKKTLHSHDSHDDTDAILSEGRAPTEDEMHKFFLPYRGFCARKGVTAKEVILHDIDVSTALVHYVIHNDVSNIVVGTSRHNALISKFIHHDVPSSLLKHVPDTCAVYVVSSKGRLRDQRAATKQKWDEEPPRDTTGKDDLPVHPCDRDYKEIRMSQCSHGSSSSESDGVIKRDTSCLTKGRLQDQHATNKPKWDEESPVGTTDKTHLTVHPHDRDSKEICRPQYSHGSSNSESDSIIEWVTSCSTKGRFQGQRAAIKPKWDEEPPTDTTEKKHLAVHPHDRDSEEINRSQCSYGSSSSESDSNIKMETSSSMKGRLQSQRASTKLKWDGEPPKDTTKKNHLPVLPHDRDSEEIRRSQCSHRSSSSESDMITFDRLSDFKTISPFLAQRSSNSHVLSVDSLASETFALQHSHSSSSDFSGPLSFQSTGSDNNESNMISVSSQNKILQSSLDVEMARLRQELKQTMAMYALACKEALASKQKAWELQKWKTMEEHKLLEAKFDEEAALALAEMERQKSKAAMDAARMAQRRAEIEIQKRKMKEMQAYDDSKLIRKAMDALSHKKAVYRKYSIEEIEVATNYFSKSNKIGEGGYGPVYKGVLNYTPVAIKVLRDDMSQGKKQFQQEVDVLSYIRHPHMVLLVGTCPEYGCLIYEYMEKGSLEDRLLQKDGTPPIPWPIRFKIAAEIATGLHFLHQTKPEPLVHRDLKPANILLDRNYVSKISDVGLARLVPPCVADCVTRYRLTEAAGTFCYIDPEYQQTGMLSVHSDIYSLGIMLLQIITSKPAMGLSHKVEESIKNGTFADMLDPAVPDWPVEKALSFAKLALKCCEMRRKDRPDLWVVILPELERLQEFGINGEANNYVMHSLPPVPVVRSSRTASQINDRRSGSRLKSMSKLMSFRNESKRAGASSAAAAISASENRCGSHDGRCWSFVSQCSSSGVPHPHLRRYKSFS